MAILRFTHDDEVRDLDVTTFLMSEAESCESLTGWTEDEWRDGLTRNKVQAVAFKIGQGAKARSMGLQDECSPTLGSAESGTQRAPGLVQGSAVRRLTPRECERLQGFPDDWTLVTYRNKPAADGPRYKALGNSMAVPVMRWIGERIAAVDHISSLREAA